MRWVRLLLAAASFTYPLLWLAGTLPPLVAGLPRLVSGAKLGTVFVSPLGLFFGGFRMPWRMHLAGTAVIALAGLAIFFHRRAHLANWRSVTLGLTLSASLYGSVTWVERARREQRREHTQQRLAAILPPAADSPYPKLFFQRGVCFTAEHGVGYGSAESLTQLSELAAYGVNAIALVPYGGARRRGGGPIAIRTAGRDSWESDAGIEIVAAEARRLGMCVTLKPHLWPHAAQMQLSAEDRREWLKQYRGFAETYARLAARIHADLFVVATEVGTELAREERAWREIIAAVRAVYAGPLTFAPTQGPEFESIAFWDALDYIGLDNYYPLGDNYSADEPLARVQAVQQRFSRPVIFTEAGFSAAEGAHRAPWEDGPDRPLSLREQERSYEALLKAFYAKPWFQGVYWWKLGTDGYGGAGDHSMTPWGKPAMEVVKRFYLAGGR